VERGSTSKEFDLDLTLATLSGGHKKAHASFNLENIGDWLGSCIKGDLTGAASAAFDYDGPHFKPVIPLPYTGIVPFESAIIRKSTITGIEVTVDESDIGLTRFLLFKPKANTIALEALFGFSHTVNYSMFVKLAEQAAAVGSVLVMREGRK
jgi:hypothetical protein